MNYAERVQMYVIMVLRECTPTYSAVIGHPNSFHGDLT